MSRLTASAVVALVSLARGASAQTAFSDSLVQAPTLHFLPSPGPATAKFELGRSVGLGVAATAQVVTAGGDFLAAGGSLGGGPTVAAAPVLVAEGTRQLAMAGVNVVAAAAAWQNAAQMAATKPGGSDEPQAKQVPAEQSPTETSAQSAEGSAAEAGSGIVDVLRPGGKLIGEAGSSSQIRILQGGEAEAKTLFDQLSRGGQVVEGSSYPGTLVRLSEGGRVGFRPVSTSGPPTIDVTVKGLGVREIKFITGGE